ncbi:hypothetical protein BC937DRAFT_93523 [Endogone sp. FLAS-F59071]|nr:hypothetical protein BC937DRAFT_93523 [Endogone sp. FLAS-F59071]|eukprot:RUS14635.1 hypothetical protein BC937DRAFT_93523 [Endogone sp. FLAS-F59071]
MQQPRRPTRKSISAADDEVSNAATQCTWGLRKNTGARRMLGLLNIAEIEATSAKIRDVMKWSLDDLGRILTYYKERIDVEESYQKGLERVAAKQADQPTDSIDFDIHTTARDAWIHLQMSTAKLAEQRKELITTLKGSYDSLFAMKERHEKVRKQVKKSMQEINDAYIDTRSQVVPKLRRSYELKCRELESNHAAFDKTISPPPQPPPNAGPGSHTSHRTSLEEKPGTVLASSPDDNGEHIREKRIDRFMNKVAITFANADPAKLSVKNAKVKKEIADAGGSLCTRVTSKCTTFPSEAHNPIISSPRYPSDNDYRKSIQQLEILRIKLSFITDRAFQTLDTVLNEKTINTKLAFEIYVKAEQKGLLATTNIMESMSMYIDCIKPDIDIEQWKVEFKKEGFQKPTPVNYFNFYVGESKDMIFGVSLSDYARIHRRNVPLIVTRCIAAVQDRGGLDREGIYRISGRQTTTEKLRQQFERDEEGCVFGEDGVTDDVFTIAGILKIYLRELPEPLFPFALEERIEYSRECRLFEILVVSAHADHNKMSLQNLSLIFTPAIFHDHNQDKPGEWHADRVLDDLVYYRNNVFWDARKYLAGTEPPVLIPRPRKSVETNPAPAPVPAPTTATATAPAPIPKSSKSVSHEGIPVSSDSKHRRRSGSRNSIGSVGSAGSTGVSPPEFGISPMQIGANVAPLAIRLGENYEPDNTQIPSPTVSTTSTSSATTPSSPSRSSPFTAISRILGPAGEHLIVDHHALEQRRVAVPAGCDSAEDQRVGDVHTARDSSERVVGEFGGEPEGYTGDRTDCGEGRAAAGARAGEKLKI